MTALSCRNLARRFGRVLALDGLDLDVEEGSIFGYLGRNGAGKTTTLRLVTGLARPQGGTIRVFGVDAGREPLRARRLLGYLPEQPAFHPWMTARETLVYAGRLQGLSRDECASRVSFLPERVGLQGAAGRRVGGFSKGMRQRLGLAAALVHEPPLLLLDEPVSALDPAGRKDVLELLGEFRGKVTVFMSTHILSDVERVCDTVAILDEGRLLLEAPREELLRKYATPIFEMEYEPSPGEGRVDSFLERLRALPWVEDVAHDPPRIRVHASDPGGAKEGLLRAAAESGPVLLRYEMIRPSLEDIFLRLTAAKGKA